MSDKDKKIELANEARDPVHNKQDHRLVPLSARDYAERNQARADIAKPPARPSSGNQK